jgi:TRAP-type C4-dicarboxylate transport system permease small subunit
MSQTPDRPKVQSSEGPDGAQRPPVLFVFDRLVTPLLNGVAAAVLFSLMLLTCVDVTARYFGRPIFGGFELTEIMLAALIFAGLPLVTLRNDHVTVDLFDAVTPDWLLRIQHVAACALGFVCIAFVSWRLWLRAIHIGAAGETTGQLKIPMSWLAYSMSLLTALTAVTLIILMLRPPKRDEPLTSL